MALEVNRDSEQSADATPHGARGRGGPGKEQRSVMDPPHRSRAAHVESLREMLADGTYEVPADVLAASILNVAIRARRMRALDARRVAGSNLPDPR